MALVEEYYELNEAEAVSVAWKIIEIGAYLCAGCLGLWCSYTMALLRIKFDDKCYLFSVIKNDPDKKLKKQIDWESDFWCDYCQYTMVSSFIVATIWATFFLMCGKGGKSLTGLPQPWRIVLCSLIFNIIYFSVALSASIQIQQGTEVFCEHQNHQALHLKSCLYRCRPLDILYSKNQKLIKMAALQLEIVVKTSWCCTFTWLVLILISFFRIVFVVDFQMYRICVFQIDETTQNKKEEVLKITNYEEPRKLLKSESQDKMVYYDSEKIKNMEKGKSQSGKEAKWNQFQPNTPRIQPNAAFYVTADIRMLNREKKRKKIKDLNEAFEKDKIRRSKKFRLSEEVQLSFNNPSESQPARYLYRYPNLVFESEESKNDDDDDDSESSEGEEVASTSIRQADMYRNSDFDDSVLKAQSMIFKKQL